MAVDQLSLYNDALLLIGQRALSSLTEDREPRYRLDDAYNLQAVRFCLELSSPSFSRKTTILSSPSAATTFSYTHALPADYVSIMGVFADSKLDQPIDRYIIEGGNLLTDYATVYLRHVSDGYALTVWEPSFVRVVAAYLAKEIAPRLAPDSVEEVETKFEQRVAEVIKLSSLRDSGHRSSASVVTLSNSWRSIYNDALLIMGLREITTNTDDSNRRVKMDHAVNAGIVKDLLEDTSWQFGQDGVKIEYDPSAEPEWGYQYAIPKPADLHRLDGIFQDEYMKSPLKHYSDHSNYWFCDINTVYVKYVSTDYLTTPDVWPSFFRRLVAAAIARDAAPSLEGEGANLENAISVFNDREDKARSIDAVQSPPIIIKQGNWVAARYRGGSRGRP